MTLRFGFGENLDLRIIQASASISMKKFLIMSLSVVYGDKDKHKSGTECYVIMDKIYDLKTVSNSRLC